jgi:hypothetical protein
MPTTVGYQGTHSWQTSPPPSPPSPLLPRQGWPWVRAWRRSCFVDTSSMTDTWVALGRRGRDLASPLPLAARVARAVGLVVVPPRLAPPPPPTGLTRPAGAALRPCLVIQGVEVSPGEWGGGRGKGFAAPVRATDHQSVITCAPRPCAPIHPRPPAPARPLATAPSSPLTDLQRTPFCPGPSPGRSKRTWS